MSFLYVRFHDCGGGQIECMLHDIQNLNQNEKQKMWTKRSAKKGLLRAKSQKKNIYSEVKKCYPITEKHKEMHRKVLLIVQNDERVRGYDAKRQQQNSCKQDLQEVYS